MATVCLRNILLLTLLVQLQTARTQTVCDVCEQRPAACRRIAGLYTVTVLTQGTYNPVVEIPAQACSLNITELAPSHNYLAVRTETGENIVNGYWSVGSTGSFRGAGTQFEYNRGAASCPGECILAKGPINQAVVVQLLYYSKNPGIAYEFVLPGDVLFKPFDETAPSLESRTRTSHHYQGRRQQTNASRAEPYDPAYARRQEEAAPVQEPRRQATPVQEPRRQASPGQEPRRQQAPVRQGRPEVKGGDTGVGTKDSTDYRGVSYGSHTLGGRGQSYTFQHQDSRSAGSASEDPDAGRTQPRETLRRRPVVRGQPTPVRPLPPQSYLSSEGLESQGSARRGGLADRTYSQSLESDNRLQPYDNVNVEQIGRPTLTIGGGGGGREYMWTISGFTQCSLTLHTHYAYITHTTQRLTSPR